MIEEELHHFKRLNSLGVAFRLVGKEEAGDVLLEKDRVSPEQHPLGRVLVEVTILRPSVTRRQKDALDLSASVRREQGGA